MKKCKFYQSDIDEKAKICPQCKKKQGPKIFRWVIIGLILIAIIGVALNKKEEDNFKKEYKQDEKVTYKNVEYSITKVERTKGSNEFFKAKDGYEYVKVTIKIENKSDEKVSYNALDFRMVNGEGAEADFYSITAEEDVALNSGQIDAGGKVEGVIIWEQKEGDKNLKVRYYSNFLIDKEYKFQWTLN